MTWALFLAISCGHKRPSNQRKRQTRFIKVGILRFLHVSLVILAYFVSHHPFYKSLLGRRIYWSRKREVPCMVLWIISSMFQEKPHQELTFLFFFFHMTLCHTHFRSKAPPFGILWHSSSFLPIMWFLSTEMFSFYEQYPRSTPFHTSCAEPVLTSIPKFAMRF